MTMSGERRCRNWFSRARNSSTTITGPCPTVRWWIEDGIARVLDYEQDILFGLDWSGLDVAPLVASIPDNLQGAVRIVSDIVPNAWIARQIVGRLEDGLPARGFDEARLGETAGLIVDGITNR